MKRKHLFALAPFGLVAAVTLFAACATTAARKARPLRELKPNTGTLMGEMAASIREAEGILQSDPSLTPGDYEKVASLLAAVDAAARRLDPAQPNFAHPVLSDNLPELRRAAEAAARDAQLKPPRYEEFGRLTAVCSQCHNAPL
jgi:hypothetical protein